jgi:hypothetical protein
MSAPYARAVPTVDGPLWVKERIQYLQSLLADEPDHEHREAIEAEIEKLGESIYAPKRGWRRLFGFPRQLP